MGLKRYLRIYRHYFVQYLKSRLVYQGDTYINFVGRFIEVASSVAFLGLIFTQVEQIQGWTFNELLFLAGFGGTIMNLHHFFFMNIYRFGEDYVLSGDFDRFLVRPLNPLFQVYADGVNDSSIPKLIGNFAMMVYAASALGIAVTPAKILYLVPAVVSGVLVFASIYLAFSATAFWLGKSQQLIWVLFNISDFRKYPYGIYALPVQVLLITLIPFAFATFFPATYFLQKGDWGTMQMLSLVAGPVFFSIAYRFWQHGVENYSSTGS
ncbi:MAG: ABC transporter permease [Candidatus Nanohaloarchaea archaeon]